MQLTTTAIRHKRYSTYGWNVKDDQGNYRNTLSQGEIGVLLGHKDNVTGDITQITPDNLNEGLTLNHILETRIGTRDNQPFFEASILNFDGFGGVKKVKLLPNIGNPNCLYIVESKNNEAHIWDEAIGKFIAISGGVSEEDFTQLLSNYVKKDELSNNYYNKTEINSKFENYITIASATETHNSLRDDIKNVNNKFANYYTSTTIDNKINPIHGSLNDLNNALASKADKASLVSIEDKIKALEGTTHFAGIGYLSNRPTNAKDGDIYIATDNGKEYIYANKSWIELGDVTAEQQRISEVENTLNLLTANVDAISNALNNKADTSKVAADIADAKKDVISTLNSLITSEANRAETNAKLYAEGLSSKYDKVGAAAEVKSELLSNIGSLQSQITTNTENFANYYSKSEIDNLIANAGGKLEDIDVIYGWNAILTDKEDLPEDITKLA